MTVRDHLGLTALDVAEKADHEECMIVLRAAADKGAKYLVFVSSHSVNLRELSFAQFVYFWGKVCLFINF